jgi:hypothetical protein
MVIYVYIYIVINLIFLTLICSRPGIHHEEIAYSFINLLYILACSYIVRFFV